MLEPQFLGTESTTWAELFSKFSMIARMGVFDWFEESQSFAIHPDGYAEPFFVHPCAGRYSCDRGLLLVYGWNAEALCRRMAGGGENAHIETRSFEMPIVLCALRKKGTLSRLEQLAADTFAKNGGQDSAKASPEDDVPVFVSFRPGWMPWHLSKVEVVSSATVLNQALGIFLRAEEDISLIEQRNPAQTWVRRWDGEAKKWEEGWAVRPPFAEFGSNRPLELTDRTIERVLALPQTMPTISVDFDVVPKLALLNKEAVKLRGEDGRIPLGYLFAIQQFAPGGPDSKPVTPDTGVFYPASDVGALYKFFPTILCKFFTKAKSRPREIVVSSERMRSMLRPLQLRIPFKITFHEKIPEYAKILATVRMAIAAQGGTDKEETDGGSGED